MNKIFKIETFKEINKKYIYVPIITGLSMLGVSFKTVPVGHVGLQNFFGNIGTKEYQSGFHIINPFSSLIKMDLRNQVLKDESSVASCEGLNIEANVDIVYKLQNQKAREVYMTVGENYRNVLLIPQFKSVIRNTISSYEAKALYTEKTRLEIQNKIENELKNKVTPNGIEIQDVLINKMTLPSGLRNSIENKLQMQQEQQKMAFIVEKERLESDRKQIEAEGIKKFQDIVSSGVSEQLLRWKGITATEELAKSPNSKIIIFGNPDGLPIIFNPKK